MSALGWPVFPSSVGEVDDTSKNRSARFNRAANQVILDDFVRRVKMLDPRRRGGRNFG